MADAPPSKGAPPVPSPAEAGLRFLALLAAVVTGFATVVAGLAAGTPAPTVLWRAAAVAAGTRVVAGWIGAALAASLKRTPPAAATPVEGGR
jgi:hypothetical protein